MTSSLDKCNYVMNFILRVDNVEIHVVVVFNEMFTKPRSLPHYDWAFRELDLK